MSKDKDNDYRLSPMNELLPYTMHMMETMWAYPDDKQKKVIKLQDERMARFFKRKLKDDYNLK
jgi:hypothetical protein